MDSSSKALNRPTVRNLLARGCTVLSESGVPNPRLDTDMLLCASLGIGREELYRELTARTDEAALSRFEDMLAMRQRRCPVSYILGERDFWSLSFRVDLRVLIPRHETELVVDAALRYAGRSERLIDVGTGSGCIAVAIASELPGCEVWASELSTPALEVARENLQRHGLEQRIRLVKADILPSPHPPFQMIVSNPPYVAEDTWEGLMPEVKGFEPREALVPGTTGLELYPRLADAAINGLDAGGILVVEIGFGQEKEVSEILRSRGMDVNEIIQDWSGIPRVIVASLPS